MMETRQDHKRKRQDKDKYNMSNLTPPKFFRKTIMTGEPPVKKRRKVKKCVLVKKKVLKSPKAQEIPKDVVSESNGSSLAQTFPELPLYKIFSYLELKDLTSVQYVCTHWEKVAKSQGLWKEKIWTLQDYEREQERYKWQLVNAPLLQNIVIPIEPLSSILKKGISVDVNAEVAETVICHQKHLRSLDARELEPDLIRRLVVRFSNIERICTDVCQKDVGIVLKSLKSCKKLQFLQLLPSLDWSEPDATTIRRVTQMLCENFTSLKTLDLSYFQRFLPTENIKTILERKVGQLEKLTLSYSEDSDYEILCIVSNFSNLKLHLQIEKGLNLHVLKPLKYLRISIFAFGSDPSFLNTLLNGVCMFNVEQFATHLKFYRPDGRFFRRLKVTFPSLRCLTMSFPFFSEFDDELSHFNNELEYLSEFPLLKKVCILNAFLITAEGLSHLSACPALEALELRKLKLDMDTVKSISGCTRLRQLVLNHCILNKTKHVLSLISSLCNLEILAVVRCELRDNPVHDGALMAIESECKSRHISFLTNFCVIPK